MEFLAALQSGVDHQKPSLFELLSEQQLSDLLAPTSRYLLAVATHRYPRYLLRILNNFDETYALLSLLVERYYLTHFQGSFTEHFYSLKREKVLRIRGGEVPRTQLKIPSEVRERLKLGPRDVWRNLAVLVGVPYIKRKLDESYDIHIAPSASLLISGGGPGGRRYLDRDALPPNPTFKQRVMYYYKWFLRRCYPSINAAYYFSILAFSLAYLFDSTKYSNPFMWLVGTRMRRMGEADYKAIEAAQSLADQAVAKATGRPGQGLLGMLHPRNFYPRLLSSLRLVLPASILALKFLEWWHASDFSRQLARKATESLELPPPIVSGPKSRPHPAPTSTTPNPGNSSTNHLQPSPSTPISSTSRLPIFTVALPLPPKYSTDTCPICLHPLTHPAAIQTGHVYDYRCVFQWLEGTHDRQVAFMRGEAMSDWEGEDDDEKESAASENVRHESREGKWENGFGRDPITGKRVLGGTQGIRRIIV